MKKTLVVLVVLLSTQSFATWPDGGPKFEDDRCGWFMHHLATYIAKKDPNGSIVTELYRPKAERFADRADAFSKMILGENALDPDDIPKVRWRDFPWYNPDVAKQKMVDEVGLYRRNLRPVIARMFTDPNSMAEPWLQDYLVQRRTAELRAEEEAAKDEQKVNPFYTGEPVEKMIVVGGIPRDYQDELTSSLMRHYDPDGNIALLSLVDETYPLEQGRALGLFATLIRPLLPGGDELSPLREETNRLHFNAPQFIFVHTFDADNIHAYAAHDLALRSLNYMGREEVVIQVPLDLCVHGPTLKGRAAQMGAKTKDVPYSPMDSLTYVIHSAVLEKTRDGNSVETEKMKPLLEEALEKLAAGLVNPPNRGPIYKTKPAWGLTEKMSVVPPKENIETSLNYDFIFYRVDGKRIRIRFVSHLGFEGWVAAISRSR